MVLHLSVTVLEILNILSHLIFITGNYNPTKLGVRAGQGLVVVEGLCVANEGGKGNGNRNRGKIATVQVLWVTRQVQGRSCGDRTQKGMSRRISFAS
jgi:hypothetical protein